MPSKGVNMWWWPKEEPALDPRPRGVVRPAAEESLASLAAVEMVAVLLDEWKESGSRPILDGAEGHLAEKLRDVVRVRNGRTVVIVDGLIVPGEGPHGYMTPFELLSLAAAGRGPLASLSFCFASTRPRPVPRAEPARVDRLDLRAFGGGAAVAIPDVDVVVVESPAAAAPPPAAPRSSWLCRLWHWPYRGWVSKRYRHLLPRDPRDLFP